MSRNLLGAGFGRLWASASRADTALDVQILQTASSLEALAVAAYDAVLAGGAGGAVLAGGAGTDALTAFATATRRRHEEHLEAFQAQTLALDANAPAQDAPNPKFLQLLTGADLSTPERVVEFAARVEKVATDSYLLNLAMLGDAATKALMGSVMCVEAQHLAILRVAGASPLVAVPDMMKVPTAIGGIAFPAPLHQVGRADEVAEPASGAVR